jgi:hypothetical protein
VENIIMEVKNCEHRTIGGNKCGAPALRDRAYCRHHIRFYDPQDVPSGRPDYLPAVPDAPEAALLSVHQATRAFLAGKIDERTCRLLIHAARINSQIMAQRLAEHRFSVQLDRDDLKRVAEEERADVLLREILRAMASADTSPETMKKVQEILKPLQRPPRTPLPGIDRVEELQQ